MKISSQDNSSIITAFTVLDFLKAKKKSFFRNKVTLFFKKIEFNSRSKLFSKTYYLKIYYGLTSCTILRRYL